MNESSIRLYLLLNEEDEGKKSSNLTTAHDFVCGVDNRNRNRSGNSQASK